MLRRLLVLAPGAAVEGRHSKIITAAATAVAVLAGALALSVTADGAPLEQTTSSLTIQDAVNAAYPEARAATVQGVIRAAYPKVKAAIAAGTAPQSLRSGAALAAYAQITGKGFSSSPGITNQPMAPTHLSKGCWGPYDNWHQYKFAGVVNAGSLGLVVDGFCWNKWTVTHWGPDSTQGPHASSFFCWTNGSPQPNDWWFHRYTWRRARIDDYLGYNIPPFGCVDSVHFYVWDGYGRQLGPDGHLWWSKWDPHGNN